MDGWDSDAELQPHMEAANALGLVSAAQSSSLSSSRDLTSFFSPLKKHSGRAADASCLSSQSGGTPAKSPPSKPHTTESALDTHGVPVHFIDEHIAQLAAAGRLPGFASYGYSVEQEAEQEAELGAELGAEHDASDSDDGTIPHIAAETAAVAAAASGAEATMHDSDDEGGGCTAELDPTGMDRWQATGVVKAPLVAQYLVQLLEGSGGGGARGVEGGGVTKVLVFAHHQAVLDTLQGELVKHKLVFVRIDGKCSMQERLTSLKRFQREAEVVVALVSMTAGGEGLSYTAANVVLFAELHYVPGIMLQAEDRAHRLSSIAARNSAEFDNGGRVTIRYLLSHGTYDDILWPRILKRLRGIGASVNGAEIDLKASLHRFVGKQPGGATSSGTQGSSGTVGGGAEPGAVSDQSAVLEASNASGAAPPTGPAQNEGLGSHSLRFRVDAVTGVARVYTQRGMYTGRHFATDDGELLGMQPHQCPQEACDAAACVITKQHVFRCPAPGAVLAAAGLRAASDSAVLLPLPATRPTVPPADCSCWVAAASAFAQQWCAMAPIAQRELSGPLLSLPLDAQLQATVRRDLGLDTSTASATAGTPSITAGRPAQTASRERYAALHSGVVPLSQVQRLGVPQSQGDSDSSDSTDALMTQITGHSRNSRQNTSAASVAGTSGPPPGPPPVSCAHCGGELQHALALSVVGDGAKVLAQQALAQEAQSPPRGRKRQRPLSFALLSSDSSSGSDSEGGGATGEEVEEVVDGSAVAPGGAQGVASRDSLAALAGEARVDPAKLYVLPFCNDRCSKAYWGRRKSDRIRAYVGQLEMGVCQLCGFRARDAWRHVASLHRSTLQRLRETETRARLRLRRQCRRAVTERDLVAAELLRAFPGLAALGVEGGAALARASSATLRVLVHCKRAYKRSRTALRGAQRVAATDRGDFLRRLSREQWTAPPRFGGSWPCAHKAQGSGWRPRAREGDVYTATGLVLEPNEGAFWQADHLLPVVEGGGASGWCNLRTLCTECHREVTAALRRRMSVLGTGRGGTGGVVLDKVDLIRQAAREGGAGGGRMGAAGVRSGSLPGMFKRPRAQEADSSAGSVGQLLLAAYADVSAASTAGAAVGAAAADADATGGDMGFVDLVSSDDE